MCGKQNIGRPKVTMSLSPEPVNKLGYVSKENSGGQSADFNFLDYPGEPSVISVLKSGRGRQKSQSEGGGTVKEKHRQMQCCWLCRWRKWP